MTQAPGQDTARGAVGHRLRLASIVGALVLQSGCGGPLAVPLAVLGALTQGGGEVASTSPGAFGGNPTVQNGTSPDPSMAQAAQTASASVPEQCRRRLPEQPALAPGDCATRAICLPGVNQPVRMRMCNAGSVAVPASPADASPKG